MASQWREIDEDGTEVFREVYGFSLRRVDREGITWQQKASRRWAASGSYTGLAIPSEVAAYIMSLPSF